MEEGFFAYGRDFFKGWEAQRKNFITQSQQYEVRKNEMLFFEGETEDVCYYLASGLVRVFQTTDCGKEFGLRIRFPGSFISFSGVLEDLPYKTVSAQALTTGRVCIVSRKRCKEILRQERELFERAAAWKSRDCRLSDMRYLSLAAENVRERLIRLLTMLYREALPDTEAIADVPLSLPLTQTHIACMINSTQSTVSCLLRQLQKEGILTLTQGCIHIITPSALLGSVFQV